MTPKEKAKELICNMYSVEDPLHKYPMCFDTAKQCALIAVDECLKCCIGSHVKFWKEVKEEINKL